MGEGAPENMVVGERYRVRFLGVRTERVFVAKFLGEALNGLDYLFSLRPLAGTQNLRKTEVLSAMPTTDKIALPRKFVLMDEGLEPGDVGSARLR